MRTDAARGQEMLPALPRDFDRQGTTKKLSPATLEFRAIMKLRSFFRRRSYRFELAGIGLAAVGVYLIAIWSNASGRLHRALERHQASILDELLFPAMFLAVALFLFAWRRWREAALLVRERDATLQHLDAATARAESANQARGEFLASVSHEIRTPMNAIIGMTELALGTSLNGQQREYLSTVASSAHSLLQLLNDMLDFAKIDSGKLELEAAPFALRELVDNTVKSLDMTAQQKGLTLSTSVDDDVPDAVVGDPHRLRQVLVNLISNATKFTDRGTISLKVSTDSQEKDRCQLHFSVRDTGIGIPEGMHRTIFDPYSQASSLSGPAKAGAGLGLAISAKIVALMDGRLWVESTEGEGSNFQFTVDIGLQTTAPSGSAVNGQAACPEETAAGSVGPAAAAEPARGARSLRILLAEDNEVNQRVATGMLEKRGHTVVVVSNGQEAVDAVDAQDFDLVFMDIQMPVMDGLAATEFIREKEQWNGRHVPIVAMTAHAMKGDRDRCIRAGMDDYIPKPVDPGVLNAVIERLCPSTSEQDVEAAEYQAAEPSATPIALPAVDEDTFDVAELMERVENDFDMAMEMVELFLDSSPSLLSEIESAIVARDCGMVERASHALKGALQNLCAPRASQAAAKLETASHEGDVERIVESFCGFRKELMDFRNAVEKTTSEVKTES